MTSLIRYEAAKAALAEALSVDEVQAVRNAAEQMKLYARQAKDRGLMADATEIQLRAERRLGELLAAAKGAGELHGGGRPPVEEGRPPTLVEIGVGKKLSMRAQQMARLSSDGFDALVKNTRQKVIHAAPPAPRRRPHGPPSGLDIEPSSYDAIAICGIPIGDIAFGSIAQAIQRLQMQARLLDMLANDVQPPTSLTTIREAVSEGRLRDLIDEAKR